MTRVHPYGDRALLVDVEDADDLPGLRAAAAALDGVAEVVPGARTLLVVASDPRTLASLEDVLGALRPAALVAGEAEDVELQVDYDGPDLAEVAELTGLTRAEVIAAHSGASYVVRFCGFAPGFAYLDGLDARLHVPRLDEPRTRVPAGSVAIADEFAGVYPRPSPGGWRLLGTTDATLWDTERDPPALLTPGTRVRFVPR